MRLLPILALVFSSASTLALAGSHVSGNAEDGEKVFRQCRSCHSITDADGNDIQKGGRVGPNLYGVAGRTAGTYEGFKYSDSMVAAGEAGLAWDEEHFTPYVQDPTGFLRDYLDDSSARGKMTFKARKEQDALDVWAYLVSVGPEMDMEESDATN